ncbi:unnamed protein product [Calypogeia fissa]
MQGAKPQTLPWAVHMNSTVTANRVPDQITRQLMPPPSYMPFDDPTAKESSGSESKNGNVSMELMGRSAVGYNNAEVWDNLERVASENAVVMFSISSCCVCHVVKRLFSSLGVAPAVYELDQEAAGRKKYIGGLEELIAAHIGGALVPQLKLAGALWL